MQKHQRPQILVSNVMRREAGLCDFKIESHRCTRAHVHNAYWITAAQWFNMQPGGKTKNGDNDLPPHLADSVLLLVATWLIVWSQWGWSRLATPLTSCFTVTASFSSARFCRCFVQWQNDVFRPIRNFQIFHLPFDASLLSVPGGWNGPR